MPASPPAGPAARGRPSLARHAFAPGALLPEHAHEEHVLVGLLEGGYTDVGLRPKAVSAPALVFYPARAPHSARVHGRGARSLTLTMPEAWLAGTGAMAPRGGEAVLLGRETAGLVVALHAELASPDELSPLALEGLGLVALAAVARASAARGGSARPAWLDRVAARLREERSGRPDAAAMAREVGVSPEQLMRAFRRHLGCSPADYLRRARLEWVCRRLVDSRASLAEIALEAGYCDQAHLSRAFKRATGLTPSRFRAVARRW